MAKPRHLTDADCDALIGEMEAELKACKADLKKPGKDLKTARRLANDFAPDGHKSSTAGDDSPRGTDVSDPTAAQVIRLVERGPDPTQGYRSTLRNRVSNMRSAIADLAQTRTAITAHAEDPDAEDGVRRQSLGAGNCRACDRDRSGVEHDRLRGGLCDRDRKRFERDSARWDHDQVRFERFVQNEMKAAKAGDG